MCQQKTYKLNIFKTLTNTTLHVQTDSAEIIHQDQDIDYRVTNIKILYALLYITITS